MSNLASIFKDIANAIRSKTSYDQTYIPSEMSDAISGIKTIDQQLIYYNNGGIIEPCPMNYSFMINNSVNVPLVFNNELTNLSNSLNNCRVLNQPITISSSAVNMDDTFRNCVNYNQETLIPGSVNSVRGCFRECSNFKNTVIFMNSSNIPDPVFAKEMLGYTVTDSIIRCNNAEPFLGNDIYNSITGATITWTELDDGNGYYNAAKNIYIYNNYSPS